VNTIKEPSQQGIDDPFRVYAGGPEQYGRQEQHAEGAGRIPSKLFIEGPEKGDMPADGKEGKEKGIDIKVAEGEKVKKHMHPFDEVMGQGSKGGVICPKYGKTHGQLMTGDKAVPEEEPDVSLMRIIFIGYPIMQTSDGYPQCEKEYQPHRSDVRKEATFEQDPTEDDGIEKK